MRYDVVRAVYFEDGDAIGTDIGMSVGQAVVRGWDGAVLGEKGVAN